MALGLDLNLMIARGERWEITDSAVTVSLAELLIKGLRHYDVVSIVSDGSREEVWLVGQKRFFVRAPGASLVAVSGRYGMEFKYLQPASGTLETIHGKMKIRRAAIRELTSGTNLKSRIALGQKRSFRFYFRSETSPRPAYVENVTGVFYFPGIRSAEEIQETHAGPKPIQQTIDSLPGLAG